MKRLFHKLRRLLTTVLVALLVLVFLDSRFPLDEKLLRRPGSTIVFDRSGAPIRIYLSSDDKYRFPLELHQVAPELPRAMIASEDQDFFRHPGVDPVAVCRAMLSNLRAGHVVSGASTIPMQIARAIERRPRHLGSKVVEALRALQLSAHYSKPELLEIYLNLVPYGGNIEGVGAASWFYFGKPASRLSLGEVALLTTIPRSPRRYDPSRSPAMARRARDLVLEQLQERGAFTRAEVAAAKRQPVPDTRMKLPFTAPHFSDLARGWRGSPSRDGQIVTTLDRRIQGLVEAKVRSRIAGIRGRGVGNTAVVVIDNQTREVLALVGSAGFFEEKFDGQVNGAVARRSPGSTLKPFLYGQAIDEGRLVPESWLYDIPVDYSGYVPENYDGEYHGRVTMREALVRSLNAPAVRTLWEGGTEDFLELLRRGGMRTLSRPATHYGLSLALGSGEVTLLELTNLYASLADGGRYRPVELLRGGRRAGEVALFSPATAGLITSILCELKRPDMPQSWQLALDIPRIAWKTGTSFGHRDAWSVGFSSRYSVGVWVGNFDGRGQKGLSGTDFAAPILFDVFREIDPGGGVPPPDRSVIDKIEVCAVSHQLPGRWCPTRSSIEVIAGVSRTASCEIHQQIMVERESGKRVSGDCNGARSVESRLVEHHPAEYVSYLRSRGEKVDLLPPLSQSCSNVQSEGTPRIVAPDRATPYRLRHDAPVEFQEIALSAQAAGDATTLFWYLDGTLVASASPENPAFIPPTRGQHRLAVVDNLGRSDEMLFRVE